MFEEKVKEFEKIIKHIEKDRNIKADKLMRIEKIVLNCIAGGYTDEFIQEILNICWEVNNANN